LKLVKYDNNLLINFYNSNGLEFDENKNYFGKDIRSFAIKEKGKIIGAVSISKYKNKSYIEALVADYNYRNKGIGKLLLKKAIDELDKPIYIISKADKFFLKNGFEYDDSDLIGEECKNCEYYNLTCFPKVLVYR